MGERAIYMEHHEQYHSAPHPLPPFTCSFPGVVSYNLEFGLHHLTPYLPVERSQLVFIIPSVLNPFHPSFSRLKPRKDMPMTEITKFYPALSLPPPLLLLYFLVCRVNQSFLSHFLLFSPIFFFLHVARGIFFFFMFCSTIVDRNFPFIKT